jgi:glycerate kinase
MALQMETELRGELLLVTFTGSATLDSSVRLLNQFCGMLAEKPVHKILINMFAVSRSQLTTIDRYELGTKLSECLAQLAANTRLAFVGIRDGFVVKVARNRGACAEAFPSIEKALNWLAIWP